MSGLGLDYSSSDDDRDEPSEATNARQTIEDKPSTTTMGTHSETSVPVLSGFVLPTAAAMFDGGDAAVTTRPSVKRLAPTPAVNPRLGRQVHPASIGKKVNTLLPPQLRGRANQATQDLEGLGLREPKTKAPRDRAIN